MNDEKDTKLLVEELFSRVEEEGVSLVTTADGTIFVFSYDMLLRLLEDAKNSKEKNVLIFVKKAGIKS